MNFFGERIRPSPRFHASMTAISTTHELYLFGGTNEAENFADLWIFRQSTMLWEKIIPVGFVPSARYGHVLLSIEKQQTLVVIGGCTVSPVAEWEASQLPEEASIAQMHQKYQSLLDQQFIHLHKKLRGLSSTDYRVAEEKLFESWQGAKAMSYYLKKTTKHTNPQIDLYFYQIAETMWMERKFPRFAGEIPKSRMYFGAQAIGHYLFVIGGCYPTALFTKCVDELTNKRTTEKKRGGGREEGEEMMNVNINVLDLRTHTWTKPLPINSDAYYKQTMLLAEADIIRAQKKLQAERLEGISLGKNCLFYERKRNSLIILMISLLLLLLLLLNLVRRARRTHQRSSHRTSDGQCLSLEETAATEEGQRGISLSGTDCRRLVNSSTTAIGPVGRIHTGSWLSSRCTRLKRRTSL